METNCRIEDREMEVDVAIAGDASEELVQAATDVSGVNPSVISTGKSSIGRAGRPRFAGTSPRRSSRISEGLGHDASRLPVVEVFDDERELAAADRAIDAEVHVVVGPLVSPGPSRQRDEDARKSYPDAPGQGKRYRRQ